jgi:hypothetical protein
MLIDNAQACPHSSVELRLRPPGADLWGGHKPLAAELALLFTLLGAGMLSMSCPSAASSLYRTAHAHPDPEMQRPPEQPGPFCSQSKT